MAALRGTFTALITPFLENGEVDYDGFCRLIDFQIENGVAGLVPLGTTGETPTLLVEEEDKLIKLAVQTVAKRVPIIIGTGSNCTHEAVKYTTRAKNLGADYALVVTPYYNKPTDEGVFRHFQAVSEVGIPIIVYNIAGRTGKNISTDLLERIAALPNIAGVKEASGNINQVMEVVQRIKMNKPNFSVLSGDDALTLPLVAVGSDGVVSVVSNLIPDRVVEMVDTALSGDFKLARELHYKLLPIFKAAFVESNPVPIKAAMNWAGLPAGNLRLPLCSLQTASEPILRAALKASEIEI